MDQPFQSVLSQDATRMRRAAAKLTHVGPQTGPTLSILISSFYYLPGMELFRPFQPSSVLHSNDDLPSIGYFSVHPEELRRLIEVAGQVCANGLRNPPVAVLSITAVVDAPEGRAGGGFLLSQQDGVTLHREFAAALDPSNGVGQTVLRLQRDAAYRGGA